MKVLLISPLGFPINPESKYVGIERLVRDYARELILLGHEVGVFCHADSVFPEGVFLYPHKPDGEMAEVAQFQAYQSHLREYDVIHDFSHLHLTARYIDNMPTLNLFWHAPSIAKYPKAPYNIISPSAWGAREFQRVYRQKARYQYSIGIDTSLYKLSSRHRNHRFYALGRMGAEKGHLMAIMLCRRAGALLDIQGARGAGVNPYSPLSDYEREVLSYCDGSKIRYLGDLPEVEKIKLMQTNKALIYATTHPEVTNHKLQECLLCGMPVIVSDIGAAHEYIADKVNGFLCRTEDEFLVAMKRVNQLEPTKVYEEIKHRFDIKTVVSDYVKLYEEVANGARW